MNANDTTESVTAGSLKPKQIIVIEEGGKTDYVKVEKISKVKTGKHGAAKVMISGSNIKNKKNVELSFTGGSKVEVIVPVKKQWVLIDYDEDDDCIFARLNVNDSVPESLHCNEIDPECIRNFKIAYEALKDDEELIFTLVTCPKLVMIDEIRTRKKNK
ncbi:hypothetical protein EQH57_1074 [Dictyocoela roeselum]|nr:hypothetical protein EQH57_1074 [Dictyocoela roeselum]